LVNEKKQRTVTMRPWQVLYQAALLELDAKALRQRIADAEMAVHLRIAELPHDGSEECEALQGALRGLRVLADKECKP
jgi:hypothetical protein